MPHKGLVPAHTGVLASDPHKGVVPIHTGVLASDPTRGWSLLTPESWPLTPTRVVPAHPGVPGSDPHKGGWGGPCSPWGPSL